MRYSHVIIIAVVMATILSLTALTVTAKSADGPPGLQGPIGANQNVDTMSLSQIATREKKASDNAPPGLQGPMSAIPNSYQGKTIDWWVKKAHQARKDANARMNTIKRLKKTIRYSPTIEECVKLATIAYPDFTEDRAWSIIYHESWTSGKQFAKNRSSTASGLYQFLTSTFASTPYGRAGMSIWSPCASSLAAGWMHANGRGGEWAISTWDAK